jgi:hypothetical protein
LLLEAQKAILSQLGCANSVNGDQWYAGSALLNSYTLAHAKSCFHMVDLYEWDPETRQKLRDITKEMQFESRVGLSIPAETQPNCCFDGEAYIKEKILEWDKRDLVLLDPFAMWRQPSDQLKRDCYAAIIDRMLQHGPNAPSLILFWTWGRAFPSAEKDINNTNEPEKRRKNGYEDLMAKFHKAGFRFVRVMWRRELQFVMWVVVPNEHTDFLKADLELHCRRLSDHLNQTRIHVD